MCIATIKLLQPFRFSGRLSRCILRQWRKQEVEKMLEEVIPTRSRAVLLVLAYAVEALSGFSVKQRLAPSKVEMEGYTRPRAGQETI